MANQNPRTRHIPRPKVGLRPTYRKEIEARQAQLASMIIENPDGTVSLAGVMPKGGGSLYRIGLEANIERVNALSRIELHAVMIASRSNPFPISPEDMDMDEGAKRELKVWLERFKEEPYSVLPRGSVSWTANLSTVRAVALEKAAGGINAPADTYLRVMAEEMDLGERKVPYIEPAHLTNEYRGQMRLPGINGYVRNIDESREEIAEHVLEMFDYPNDPDILSYLQGMKTLLEDTGNGVQEIFAEKDYDSYESALRMMHEQVLNASDGQVKQYADEFDAYVNEE